MAVPSGLDVDACFATLRHVIAYLAEQSSAADIDGTLPQDNGYAALARVEAELSRLREEAAGYARTIVALWEEIAPGESYEELGGAMIVELATRLREERDELRRALTDELDNWNPERRPTITAEKEAAEARCAELERELDSDDHARGYRDGVREERKRSEARCARLQQALRGDDMIYAVINEVTSRWEDSGAARGRLVDREGCVQAIRDRLREALAGPDTPDNRQRFEFDTSEIPPDATVTAATLRLTPDTTADSQEFTPSRAPVDPPIVLPADSQEDKT